MRKKKNRNDVGASFRRGGGERERGGVRKGVFIGEKREERREKTCALGDEGKHGKNLKGRGGGK